MKNWILIFTIFNKVMILAASNLHIFVLAQVMRY